MRQFLLILIVAGIAIWAYFHFRGEPAPPPREPRLAKQGTFFVLEYVSVPTPNGIIGFEPGREVHFVRAEHDKGMLIVSDGEHDVEMKPSQLTNDLDIADLARNGDQSSQHQITAYIAHEKAVYAAMTKAANIRFAQDLERAKAVAKGSPPPSPSSPEPAYEGPPNSNPYSYLSSPH
jgi:hypothetical protein